MIGMIWMDAMEWWAMEWFAFTMSSLNWALIARRWRRMSVYNGNRLKKWSPSRAIAEVDVKFTSPQRRRWATDRRAQRLIVNFKHSRFIVASPSKVTEFSSLHCKHSGFLSRRWVTKSKIAERWSLYCKCKFLVAGPNRVL